IGSFFAIICLPGLKQALTDGSAPLLSRFSEDRQEAGFQVALRRLENRVEELAAFPRFVRPIYKGILYHGIREGSGRVIVGRSGTLLYRDDLEYVAGPGILSAAFRERIRAANDRREDAFEDFMASLWSRATGKARAVKHEGPVYAEPAEAVLDLHRQLRERGVELLVAVIPNKSMLYPEWATSTYPDSGGPPLHPHFLRWKEMLAKEGVRVLDMAGPLWEGKSGPGEPFYRALDTHWSPTGVARCADLIAEAARSVLGPDTPTKFPTRLESIPELAELVVHLEQPGGVEAWPRQRIEVVQVLHGSDPAVIGDAAPVLLLGDSYTMSYVPKVEKGHGGGIAAQLMQRLGRGVQTVARAGATPRAMLQILRDRPEALARKRLVILAFVDRSLGNPLGWERVPLPPKR
ncbi:MAG: hypothetical protein K2W96_24405, partial [Gemmataceae bacterium]|nr:hypothetical protein [Gemmataceae bacterium]